MEALALFKLYKNNFFLYNYTFFSIALVVGLCTSEIIMSISSISLAINWLLEGDFKSKLKLSKQRHNLPMLLVIGYFSLTLWLFNTENFAYAINDLKVKLPLLLFPLVLGTIKLTSKQVQSILLFFILGLLFSTITSFLVFLELIPIEKDLSDIRNISIFISHIRLSLLVCLGITIVSFQFKKEQLFSKKTSFIILFWLITFLFILQAFTGLSILFSLFLFYLFYILLKRKNTLYKILGVATFLIISLFSITKVYTIYKHNFVAEPLDITQLDSHSKSGEIYQYKLEDDWLENGNRVWVYIAPNELKTAWEDRSSIPFDSLDQKGQPLWGTLYRYLTSKNLRKDKEGLALLSSNEITEIEKGKTNCCENLSGFDKKIKDVIFEFERYKKGQDPNGHSFIQRIIYLEASYNLMSSNFWFGVGLGDVHDEFLDYYEQNNSLLKGKNRKRVHNQYMSFGVGIGIIGLIIWLFLLYYPLFKAQYNRLLYILFMLIISISFLTDNTLERQAGVMFFAFFNSLFLFQKTLSKS